MENYDLEKIKKIRYLICCIKVAKIGNSPFGTIIEKDGIILSAGLITKKDGKNKKQYHAERVAIEKAIKEGKNIENSILYTTIEPCSIDNKDYVSCSSLICLSGIKKVVIGLIDTNPAICGEGIKNLVEKGVEVEIVEGLEQKIFSIKKDYFTQYFNYKDFKEWYQNQYENFLREIKRNLKDKVKFIDAKDLTLKYE